MHALSTCILSFFVWSKAANDSKHQQEKISLQYIDIAFHLMVQMRIYIARESVDKLNQELKHEQPQSCFFCNNLELNH